MEVITLPVEEALPVRHQVLWPAKSVSFCRLPEDDLGSHYGVKVNDKVVCVASLFTKGCEFRLRKFATLKEYRNRGIGTLVLEHLIHQAADKGASIFWLDAREEAVDFYQKFGFHIEGPKFYKVGAPYFKMVKSLRF